MARILITAADNGFFTSSAIGTPLAPNVFLTTQTNGKGKAISFDGSEFVSLESLRYSTQMISITAQLAAVTAPRLGEKTTVTVSEVSFLRLEGGTMVEYAHMALPEPITLTATYLSYGVNDTPSWQFDLGLALEDALNAQNFKFVGGDGDDIFNPHLDMLPYYGRGAIFGGGGNDTLTGTAGSDFIGGGDGNDTLIDNYGANTLRGGMGNDTLTVGNGSAGSTLKGGAGDDVITSGGGSDFLYGGSGHDKLIGGRGNDELYGNRGRDVLNGGEGADLIDGGRGHDTLTGGRGNDVFVFRALDKGRDVITDFEDGSDMIEILGLSYADLVFTSVASGTLITSEAMAGQIMLEGVDITTLDASDFIF
ncbi:MAG: hypothetical protein COB08_001875 [Rhodobacteraceae bacterium]|nr:hypothetical protein [Paracoccaceae bacterium]